MDNLLNIASEVMKGFDPAVDKVDDFEKLPDGEYNCLLEDVTARKNEKGTNWISFKFSIIDGDYANRIIFVNYFFTEKTSERSVKGIIKLAYDFGYQVPEDCFGTYEALAGYLNGIAGNQATVKQTTSKNDFTNYKVTPVA
jgi:hypothetical protein